MLMQFNTIASSVCNLIVIFHIEYVIYKFNELTSFSCNHLMQSSPRIEIIINLSTNEIKVIPLDIEITACLLFRIAEEIDSGLLSY